jgi:hypothetical protein
MGIDIGAMLRTKYNNEASKEKKNKTRHPVLSQ